MSEALPVVRPTIDFTGIGNVAVERRVRLLDKYIHQDPAAVLEVIDELGDLGSIDYAERNDRETTLKRNLPDVVAEYFGQRYDDSVSYDPATEKSLQADKAMKELLLRLRGATSNRVQTGKMTSNMRPNAEAPELRDKARKYRLAYYVGSFVDQVVAQPEQAPPATAGQPSQLHETG